MDLLFFKGQMIIGRATEVDGRLSYIWKMHKYYTPFTIDQILDHRLVMMYDLAGTKKINVAQREICGCDLLLTELSKQL